MHRTHKKHWTSKNIVRKNIGRGHYSIIHLVFFWILFILLKIENNKKNNFQLLFTLTKYCSFALMHSSCPMNSARGTGKEKNADVKCVKHKSKLSLIVCLDVAYFTEIENLLLKVL